MEHPFYLRMLATLFRFVLLFGGLFFLLWYYLRKTKAEAPVVPAAPAPEGNDPVFALRLQACERLVLFLERIHPSGLVMRLNEPELTAGQLQILLVRTVREEFEYNLSQQLYISSATWEKIRNAKEETIALINRALMGLPEGASASQLVKGIMDEVVTRGKLPVETALELLKQEARRSF